MKLGQKSVAFSWDKENPFDLLKSCETDTVFDVVKKHVPSGALILEAGCGLGRYVRFLNDRGWQCVGLEYSTDAVKRVNEIWPDLKVLEGDVSAAPFDNNVFDAIISLGVVEHFPSGPSEPLQDMLRILKPGGIAIITVPCLSTVRQLKRIFMWPELVNLPRVMKHRLVDGEYLPFNRSNPRYIYAVDPPFGEFFEYHMSRSEFAMEVEHAGFRIIDQCPHAILDGIYGELSPLGKLISLFRRVPLVGTLVGNFMMNNQAKWGYWVSHMQMIIATKNEPRDTGSTQRTRSIHNG